MIMVWEPESSQARGHPVRVTRRQARSCNGLHAKITDFEIVLVYERGKIASWIAPPSNGINGKPVDYEYVHLRSAPASRNARARESSYRASGSREQE